VARVVRDARQHSLLPLHRKGPAGVTQGSRRRSFHDVPDTAAPAGNGTGESRGRQRCSTRVMERFADARSQPTQA